MNNNAKRWNLQQEKGNFFLLRLTLWLYRHLGRYVFSVILNIIIFWYWLFSATFRHNSLNYLQHVYDYSIQFEQSVRPFPKRPQIFHTYTHLKQFAIAILDKIDAWLGTTTERDLQLFGHEHIRQYYGKGAVILVSHFGNIEMLRGIKAEHHQVVNVLVYHQHAEQFNAFLQSINPKAGVKLFSVSELGAETAIQLQERIDAGEWVVLAVDRIPVKSSRQQAISFLGESAYFPEGAWWLAHLLHAPVLAVFCYRHHQRNTENTFQLHVHPLSDGFQLPRKDRQQVLCQYMTRYVEYLQQHCLKSPYQWFNFFDFWQITQTPSRRASKHQSQSQT